MKHQQFSEQVLESAWQEVEIELKLSGFVSPAPGFGARFRSRLEMQRVAREQKQAWLVVAINLVIALGFLILIGIQFVPTLPTNNNFISFWVELFSKSIIFIKMIWTILETFIRTIPSLIPSSWWMNAAITSAVLFILWISLMRQHVQKQGVMA
ncbi:MAG: hypothetical protein PVF83_15705 [Anaerolineales bacterium]|jgi:hypothetical protein